MPTNLMTDAEKAVEWLQELIDILSLDLYVDRGGEDLERLPGDKYYIEFSGCCYLNHTIRLIRDHFEKADFSGVPRVHTGTFNYDTGKWEEE